MTNGKTEFLACGACAIIVDEDGQMTTSVDLLVNGVKRLIGRARRTTARRTTAQARI